MSFLKKIFSKKDEPVRSYADFWKWFEGSAKEFHAVVKNRKDIEKNFFDKISPKLQEIKDGYFYLTGMLDQDTVELVFTAEGNTKNIAFVEELVAAAPPLNGWKFTSLKPTLNIEDVNITMAGYEFSASKLSFYANEFAEYPDEIDITIIHSDLTEENEEQIANGTYIFLDNYLGELDFVNNIDNLKIVGPAKAEKELIPIIKLKDFLTWRQKEFIEKYETVNYDTSNDNHSVLEAELQSGDTLIALINTEILNWDNKASHPWISIMTIKYDGSKNNGMPDKKDFELLDDIEEEMMQELKDIDGYLNIGRQTSKGEREIYFACKDFRKPSKVFFSIQKKYAKDLEMDYEIYKDKYWQTFEKFNS